MKKIYALSFLSFFLFQITEAQDGFYIDGDDVIIESGATLFVEGTLTNANGGTLNNQGTIDIDLIGSSTQGDFDNQATGVVTNDGTLTLQGDLTNNGTFQNGASGARTVTFDRTGLGATDQQVLGTMDGAGGVNNFYTLGLDNSTIIGFQEYQGLDLSSVTGSTVEVTSGINFTSGIIKTSGKEIYVSNDDPAAITGYGSLKYVDTDGAGTLKREIRTIPGTHTYFWPVGGGSEKYTPAELEIRGNTNSVSAMVGSFVPMSDVGDVPGLWEDHAVPCLAPATNFHQWVSINSMVRDLGHWNFTPDGATTGWDYDMTGYVDDPTVATLTDYNSGFAPYIIYKMIKTDQNPSPLMNWYTEIASSGDLCSVSNDLTTGVSATSLSDFSNFGIGGGSSIGLPVELLYLQADAIDNSFIKVHWATAVEVNNAGFHVQRSLDGVNFENIGWVDGNGSTSVQQNYFLDDHNVSANVIYYYRLKQVDHDGSFEYTDIVQATLNAGEIFSISNFYPSPTEHGSSIQITSTIDKEINITIYNMLGQILSSDDYNIVQGTREISYDFSDLPSATYHAIITAGNEVYNKQVVVTR